MKMDLGQRQRKSQIKSARFKLNFGILLIAALSLGQQMRLSLGSDENPVRQSRAAAPAELSRRSTNGLAARAQRDASLPDAATVDLSDVSAAIEQFRAAHGARLRDNHWSISPKRGHSNDTSAEPGASQAEPAKEWSSDEARRKQLIRSRYRLRSNKDNPAGSGQLASGETGGAWSWPSGLSNFSQPFEHGEGRAFGSSPSQQDGEALAEQQARSAGGVGVGVGASASGELEAGPVPAYEPAPMVGRHPFGWSAQAVPLAVRPTHGLRAALQLGAAPSAGLADSPYYLVPAASAQSTAVAGAPGAPGEPAQQQLYVASAAASDYAQQPGAGNPERDNHYTARANYSAHTEPLAQQQQPEFASSQHLSSLDYYLDQTPLAHHQLGLAGPARNRWSWPWIDASGEQLNLGNPLAASTFKKHHHHHYLVDPPKHKQPHHHHHESEHQQELAPKWEHGISLGEIACIALAVVLGVIILGSPFFLLFLMLFNGGNLFGATQMGLLAPASVQAASGAAPAAGKRRRRRSLDEALAQLRASDLLRAGEQLLERLGPALGADSEQLALSLARVMQVKGDIERIISKLGAGEQAGGASTPATPPAAHVEMRRRRKR